MLRGALAAICTTMVMNKVGLEPFELLVSILEKLADGLEEAADFVDIYISRKEESCASFLVSLCSFKINSF